MEDLLVKVLYKQLYFQTITDYFRTQWFIWLYEIITKLAVDHVYLFADNNHLFKKSRVLNEQGVVWADGALVKKFFERPKEKHNIIFLVIRIGFFKFDLMASGTSRISFEISTV